MNNLACVMHACMQAWFRELPNGILDQLIPNQVMECESEEDCVQLASLLPSAESGLLDWAIDLMADVVQQEHHNKMNQHNIATVFAPNMTQVRRKWIFFFSCHVNLITFHLSTLLFLNWFLKDGRSFDCADARSTSDEISENIDTKGS